jgi:hypothetical protein
MQQGHWEMNICPVSRRGWPKAIGGLGDFLTGLPGANGVAIAVT